MEMIDMTESSLGEINKLKALADLMIFREGSDDVTYLGQLLLDIVEKLEHSQKALLEMLMNQKERL